MRLPGLVALVVSAVLAATLAVLAAQGTVASTAYAAPETAASTPAASAAAAGDAAQASATPGTTPALATTDVSAPRYGIDVSWPQCGVDLPAVALDFAVVGLTQGHAGTVNPCLREQVAWARSQHLALNLYVVPSSPSAATEARARGVADCPSGVGDCSSYAAGVVQARDALRGAKAADVSAHAIWLDVEESVYGTLWSQDTSANVAVLHGWVDTLQAAGTTVGVYSTGGYWTMITDDWQADLPQWVAVGLGGVDAARSACAQPFTTGPVVLTQWLTGPYDGNLLCPQNGVRATARAAALFRADWTHATTRGVPDLMTIAVPHPEIAAQLALLAQAEADAKAKHDAEAKAKKDKAKAAAAAAPTSTPAPKPSAASTAPAAPGPATTTPTPAPTSDPLPDPAVALAPAS